MYFCLQVKVNIKTVARYIDDNYTSFDGSYVSTLIKLNQVFVNGVTAYDPAEARAAGLLPFGPKVTYFTLVDGSTTDSVIGGAITFSNFDVGTIYLLFSSTQTTPPTPAQIKANGVAFPGNTTTFTIGNLVLAQVYYGWLLAEDTDGNDSEILPSVPASFQTDQYIDFIHDGIILDPRVTFTRARQYRYTRQRGKTYRGRSKQYTASRRRSNHAHSERLAHRGGQDEHSNKD